ncbi:tetratricopeptide repeat protein [Microtetraspora malaysiensis]|uniref:tetratricopeptide repeat protein n=1 Tax=Microtetraspora malaysiensis TaxID=161358 RepID=UPI003D8BAC04
MNNESTGEVKAQAFDEARQYNVGRGVMHIHEGAQRPKTALFTVTPPLEMVGRQREISEIVSAAEKAFRSGVALVVLVVHGMAGAGKTALARAVAVRLSSRFSHARLEIDLHGFTPGTKPRDPGEVLATWLGLAGFRASDIPLKLEDKTQVWRAWLAEREVLLLLDNAHAVEQVLPLLPGEAPCCLTLVTSRDTLDDLEAVVRLELERLPPPDAVALLVSRSGRQVVANDGLLLALAERCGFLPLALRPLGALLARRDAADLLEAMDAGKHRFQHLPQVDRAVTAAFMVSYDSLDEDKQRLVRVCGWHPGPNFGASSIGALSGSVSAVAASGLDELHRKGMLMRHSPNRYTFHDLFLDCARQRAETIDSLHERNAGLHRLYVYLQGATTAATTILTNNYSMTAPSGANFTTPAQARHWLASSTDELLTAAHAALNQDWGGGFTLGANVGWWLQLDDRTDQAATLYTALRTRAISRRDRQAEADAMVGLAGIAAIRSDYEQAVQHYSKAQTLYEEAGHLPGQAGALFGLAEIARILRHDYEGAVRHYLAARTLYEEIDDTSGQARAVRGLADLFRFRGAYEEAVQYYVVAQTLYVDIGNRSGQADTILGLAEITRLRDEYEEATRYYVAAQTLYEELGNRSGQARAVFGLAQIARLRGEHEEAIQYYLAAQTRYEEIGNRSGQARSMLGLGDIARLRGESDQGIQHYSAANAISEEIGDPRSQAHALRGLAELWQLRGEYEQGIQHYSAANSLSEKIGDPRGQAHARLGLGEIARLRGDYERADEFYGIARTLYEEISNRRGQANVYLGMARLAEVCGRQRSACVAYSHAEILYRDIGMMEMVRFCREACDRLSCF